MRISDWSSDVCSSDLTEAVEVVQNPRPGRGREAPHRHHAQVLVAKHGRQAADQCGVGQQRVDVEDRKSVVSGKNVSVRVDLGGRRLIEKKTTLDPLEDTTIKTQRQ